MNKELIQQILNSHLNDFEDAICPDGERHNIIAIMGNKVEQIAEQIINQLNLAV